MYGYESLNSPAYSLAQREPSNALQDVAKKLSQLPRHARVLNLGCGDGVFEHLAIHRDYNLTSIDIEPAAIKKLQELFKQSDNEDEALVGDITHLDTIPKFPDTQFNAVVSWRVLHGISPEYYNSIFQQIKNSTKPQSSFFISVASDEDWKAKALGQHYVVNGVNDCTGVMFKDYSINRTTPFPVHFFNESELLALGQKNGFTAASVKSFMEPSGYQHLRDKMNTYLLVEFIHSS
jgi:cyclopropane fatty-acyl-phospholipid synthase-like methyltransferase